MGSSLDSRILASVKISGVDNLLSDDAVLDFGQRILSLLSSGTVVEIERNEKGETGVIDCDLRPVLVFKVGNSYQAKLVVEKELVNKQTEFQAIKVIKTKQFGNVLILDDEIKISEIDGIYKDNLVGPLARAGNQIRSVLILGGGNGVVLNAIIKNCPHLVKATMVEIDEEVINVSKKHLSSFCEDAFGDKKTDIIIGDAFAYLNRNEQQFDAMIFDLTMEPITEDLSKEEFQDQLFLNIKTSLTPGGAATIKCCRAHDQENFELTDKLLKKYFDKVEYSKSYIPSYMSTWIFATVK